MKLDIVSFHIRCCDDVDGNSIAKRAPRLNKVISAYNSDIICLQEYRPAWEKYIEGYFLENYDMFSKYRNNTIDIEASPILWRKDKFECLKTGYFWLSDTPEVESRGWDELCNCYRMCIYAVLKEKQSGETFTVMNTHFGFGDNCQVDSAKLIYEYSKNISNHKTFITGDFNMCPDSLGYKEMTKLFNDVNAFTAKNLSTTYHGYKPDVINDQHIDYCFIDKDITPSNQKIITETVDGKFPSDHYGLFIELDI